VQKKVTVGSVTFGNKPFVFIGGPCVIEGREITLRTAEKLHTVTNRLGVPLVFKSSYDKANRTSLTSFRGLGIEEGLDIL
jgi:2-dehydro-3-deoxyphosphooctonate aldolase (KDO 8-P synthase)